MSGGSEEKKQEKLYRFYPEDFKALAQAKPLHHDFTIDITESRYVVRLRATFLNVSGGSLKQLDLDCHDLTVSQVELIQGASPLLVGDQQQPESGSDFAAHVASFGKGLPCEFNVDANDRKLRIQLAQEIAPGAEFVVSTVSQGNATSHILEGIYYDYTREGCPKTQITQCQQYGFQRIAPAVDAMLSKPFWTTTIIADHRYTQLISNGDMGPGYFLESSSGFVPENKVVDVPDWAKDAGDAELPRHQIVYHKHQIEMSPYLFFLGVGADTWTRFRRVLEYPDGHAFTLELLPFQGLVEDGPAISALNSLHDSMMWLYVSTGPETYEHHAERKEIYELIEQREAIKAKQAPLCFKLGDARELAPLDAADEKALADIRARLKDLLGAWSISLGHQYKAQMYKEISMINSSYGGMENVSCTTIIASRLVASEYQSDPGFIYLEAVKVHEAYHDLNGSLVTGNSPFAIWLNEAVTVHIERARTADLFDPDYVRLRHVAYANTPGSGPLAMDLAPNALAVEPAGFNQTTELITAMTYFKAPEFVRMIQTLIGDQTFVRGLHLYHTKYAHGNASPTDWVNAMSEASGEDLSPFAHQWLHRTKFPCVSYSGAYDEATKTYKVEMRQTGHEKTESGEPWTMPISWALVKDGQNMLEGVYRFDQDAATLVIENVAEKPDFLSFARSFSFYGRVQNESSSVEELELQALSDPDAVNKYLAYRTLSDRIKGTIVEQLLEGKRDQVEVPQSFVDLHARILFDDSLSPGTRALMLREASEIPSRPDLAHRYQEISDARNAMLQAIVRSIGDRILALYRAMEEAARPGPHKEQLLDRALKHHLLNVLSAAVDSPHVVVIPELARNLIAQPFMSDKLCGVRAMLECSTLDASERAAFYEETLASWQEHPDQLEAFIGVIAYLDSDEAPQLIRQLVDAGKPVFDINLAGHARTIARGWSANRKRSLLTEDGLNLLVYLFLKIGKVNQMSAQAFLQAFGDLEKFEDGPVRDRLIATLKEMQAGLDASQQESLYNQLRIMLKSTEQSS